MPSSERSGIRSTAGGSRAWGGRSSDRSGGATAVSDKATSRALYAWLQAKNERDYATADALRAELRAKGIEPEEVTASLRMAAALAAANADERGRSEKLGGGGGGGGGGRVAWGDRAEPVMESLEEQLGLKPPVHSGRVAEVLRQQHESARGGGARDGARGTAARQLSSSAGARGGARGTAARQSSSSAGLPSMARVDAEALAEEWMQARRDRDYATADDIRARLRAHGLEPDEIAAEIEAHGRTPTGAHTALGGSGISSASGGASASENVKLDGYKPTVERPEGLAFGPTDAAKNHKDGGTGGLLALNYSAIEPLPEGIGFTVTSSHFSATAQPLLALKRIQLEEEAREKEKIRQRNAQQRNRN
jgi:hypothetical protein